MLGISGDVLLLLFLYFVQGLPYGLQSQFLPVYLRSRGLSLTGIGLLKLLYMPWLCKCLWGPLVDRCLTRRKWLLCSIAALGGVCLVASLTPLHSLPPIALVLLLLNLFSSIQDVAVDATAIGLLSSQELGLGNTAQVVGYKLGSIFAGGVLGSLMDTSGSWSLQFLALTLLYVEATLFVYVSPSLRNLEQQQQQQQQDEEQEQDQEQEQEEEIRSCDDLECKDDAECEINHKNDDNNYDDDDDDDEASKNFIEQQKQQQQQQQQKQQVQDITICNNLACERDVECVINDNDGNDVIKNDDNTDDNVTSSQDEQTLEELSLFNSADVPTSQRDTLRRRHGNSTNNQSCDYDTECLKCGDTQSTNQGETLKHPALQSLNDNNKCDNMDNDENDGYDDDGDDDDESPDDVGALNEGGGFISGLRELMGRVLSVEGTGWMIGYLIICKMGETGALAMLPMLMLDRKISPGHVTFWTGLVGQGVSVLGSVVSGWLLTTLRDMPVKFILQQISLLRLLPVGLQLIIVVMWSNTSHTLFHDNTFSSVDPSHTSNESHLSFINDNTLFGVGVLSMLLLLFLGGMMTTVVFTLMMQCSRSASTDLQATHYTILSTSELVGKLLFSSLTGYLSDLLGYRLIFIVFISLSYLSTHLLKYCPTNFSSHAHSKHPANESEDHAPSQHPANESSQPGVKHCSDHTHSKHSTNESTESCVNHSNEVTDHAYNERGGGACKELTNDSKRSAVSQITGNLVKNLDQHLYNKGSTTVHSDNVTNNTIGRSGMNNVSSSNQHLDNSKSINCDPSAHSSDRTYSLIDRVNSAPINTSNTSRMKSSHANHHHGPTHPAAGPSSLAAHRQLSANQIAKMNCKCYRHRTNNKQALSSGDRSNKISHLLSKKTN